MDTANLTPQQIAAFKIQLKDFRDHITHSEAWIIYKYFDRDVDAYFDAPKKFAEFKLLTPAEKTACYKTVYRNIRLFNMATKNMDHHMLHTLINKIPGTQTHFPWALVKAAVKPYLLQSHGRLTWRKRTEQGIEIMVQTYNDHYSIGRDAMKEIFADLNLLARVLSFQSDYYSPRCRHLIKRSIALNKKKALDAELDAVLDEMVKDEAETTKSPTLPGSYRSPDLYANVDSPSGSLQSVLTTAHV